MTETGLKRRRNEDSIVMLSHFNLWAVADGMGGEWRGDWASNVIASALQKVSTGTEFEQNFATIRNAIYLANKEIYDAELQDGKVIGSTVVGLHICGSRFAVFWAGDSRAYLLRRHRLHLLTKDHTRVQELVNAGLLGVEEAERHPAKHILSRAVGDPDLELDSIDEDVEVNDVFLLCSDGLTNVVEDDEIHASLLESTLDAAIRRLSALVYERGAPDNLSLIAVACDASTSSEMRS